MQCNPVLNWVTFCVIYHYKAVSFISDMLVAKYYLPKLIQYVKLCVIAAYPRIQTRFKANNCKYAVYCH